MSSALKKSSIQENLNSVSAIMADVTGNQFGPKQNSMVESRLRKRAMDLNIKQFEEYFAYFWKNQERETLALISLLTTHHTYFFREFNQFEYLEEKFLPELVQIVRQRGDKKIKIWSAACSRGQEVYSLAMFVSHYLTRFAPDLTFDILGSDIDPESVAIAKNGVYSRKEIKEVPLIYLSNHWARGTGEIADFVKAKGSLRERTRWVSYNLLSLPSTFNEKFDFIFCRNVFIYFNQDQIKQITSHFLNRLEKHGRLFLGISETLTGLNIDISTYGPSIYGFKAIATPFSEKAKTFTPKSTPQPLPLEVKTKQPTVSVKEVLRVLCVDDSPSILTLLKKILIKEEGFEVVGTAASGLEVAQKIKELKPDVLTLDIHMPQQTGVEYLEKNYSPGHPPVVMVTSVSREDNDLAMKALSSGASDYVEKPALNNVTTVGEQLRRKLRSAYRNVAVYKEQVNLELDQSFRRPQRITVPERHLRLIVCHLSDKKRVETLIEEMGRGQPPTFIMLEGANEAMPKFAKDFKFPLMFCETIPALDKPDQLFLISMSKQGIDLKNASVLRHVSILIYGEISDTTVHLLSGWKKAQVLIEDLGTNVNEKNPAKKIGQDCVPATSFGYMSIEYFGGIK